MKTTITEKHYHLFQTVTVDGLTAQVALDGYPSSGVCGFCDEDKGIYGLYLITEAQVYHEMEDQNGAVFGPESSEFQKIFEDIRNHLSDLDTGLCSDCYQNIFEEIED